MGLAVAVDAVAGYSGTPLPQKLGIKSGHRVAVLDPPDDFEVTLGPLSADVVLQGDLSGGPPLDVIVAFVPRRADLEQRLAGWRARLASSGGLWVAWPKRGSGVATDVTENAVRDVALPTGLVDNKVAAIDGIWSGLRLAIRRALRG